MVASIQLTATSTITIPEINDLVFIFLLLLSSLPSYTITTTDCMATTVTIDVYGNVKKLM